MSESPQTQAETPEAQGRKVKVRKPKQRACDEKNEKGKMCMGHLKRWYEYPAEVEREFGAGAEVYRCERCQTLYTPDPAELPRSYVLRA